jgi:hypothetical protein
MFSVPFVPFGEQLMRKLLIAGTISLVTGCASGIRIETNTAPGVDFTAYETYRWGERTDYGTSGGVYNLALEGRVQRSVNSAMSERGYRRVLTDDADLIVAWHGALKNVLTDEEMRRSYLYAQDWYESTEKSIERATDIEVGTLVIDIVDAGTKKVVWTSQAQAELQRDRSVEESEKILQDAVAKMFEGLPRRD